MKQIKLATSGILSIGLLTGCTNLAAPQQKEESKVEQVKAVAEVNYPKVWKDVSTPEGFNNYGIEPTLEAWIAYHAEDIAKATDVYEYYPKADILISEMKYFQIQGDDLQKDFDNLSLLNAWLGHLVYFSKQDSQEPDGTTYNDELNKSFKYFTELLHDLDIVINHNGKGETFGLTRQLDGNKVKEFESYLNGTIPY